MLNDANLRGLIGLYSLLVSFYLIGGNQSSIYSMRLLILLH